MLLLLLLLILALLAEASSFIMELFNTNFSIFECLDVYIGICWRKERRKESNGKGKQCADYFSYFNKPSFI